MPAPTAPCPECGNDARQVKTETVRNMIEPFGNQDVEDDVQYRLCKTQDCPVVYFADEIDQRLEVDVIREPPNLKLTANANPYPLCCCFGYTKQHIREDIQANGETTIDDWITERVQAEECACRWKSPLGGCCLGNVKAASSEAQEEVATR